MTVAMDSPDEKDKTQNDRRLTIFCNVFKILLAVMFLYFFIVSLGIMSDGFQVLGGASLNKILEEHQDILGNPICGLMIGTLITVLVQSSSTSTSVIITMVGAGILKIEQAIYMVMGCNIGTSVTSTLVAFGNAGHAKEFGRAVASAVVLSAFNFMTALVLLPIEVIFGFLKKLTGLCVEHVRHSREHEHANANSTGGGIDPIAYITGPIKDKIMVLNSAALGAANYTGSFVQYCEREADVCDSYCNISDTSCTDKADVSPGMCLRWDASYSCKWQGDSSELTFKSLFGEKCNKAQDQMFSHACYSDELVGGLVLIIALIIMFASLISIVKCLKSVLAGEISNSIHLIIDKNLPAPFTALTPYGYILFGVAVTCGVQSSSIVCSIITPLCGIGVISLERAYAMIIGCCIGTTATGLIAAFANMGDAFANCLQVSLAHLFFNCLGLLMWYVIPIMRLPITLAVYAGKQTEKYRWWAVCWIIGLFFLIPFIAFLISLWSEIVLTVICCVILVIFLFVLITNWLREAHPNCLPGFLHSWKWLPLCMRSLEPIDRIFCSRSTCCDTAKRVSDTSEVVITGDEKPNEKSGQQNAAFAENEL